MRIDSVGWLGLNQTTKEHAGQVAAFKNTNNTNSWLSVNVNNNTGIGGVVFGDSDSWNPAYIQYDHTNNYMQFITNGTERLRITSGGNVGINKTSGISAKLHIGDTSNDGALSQLVKLANDSSGSGTGAQLNLGAGSANESTAACIGGFYDGTGTSFIIKTAGTYANQSTVAERLRITSAGDLALGDTAITGYEKFYCKGSHSGTSGIYIHNANGATNSSADLWFGNWTTAATNANYAARISAVNKNVNTATTDLRFHIYDGNNVLERMRIQHDGKVSIGGIQAYTAFEVKGHSTNWGNAVYGMTLTGDRDISTGYAGSGILLGGEYKTNNSEVTTFGYISGVKENTTSNNYAGSLRMGTRVAGAGLVEALRIDSGGYITTGGKTSANHGSPKFLLWGSDPYFYFGSTNSVNNSSNVGIKFAVAGGSTGDYSKAGIFAARMASYNYLDLVFATRQSADATGVSVSDEKMRIDSHGRTRIRSWSWFCNINGHYKCWITGSDWHYYYRWR